MRESEKKLAANLKAKNSELCRARLSEGRLQIEANKLKSEKAVFNARFDAVIVKFRGEVRDV